MLYISLPKSSTCICTNDFRVSMTIDAPWMIGASSSASDCTSDLNWLTMLRMSVAIFFISSSSSPVIQSTTCLAPVSGFTKRANRSSIDACAVSILAA
ncbi:Uncharacterised protein [Mycobacteroides abscessus subsp. abscessus]|nr:Uncharacterised protein [Mycobacteroides abscessus subsp. abscessus]